MIRMHAVVVRCRALGWTGVVAAALLCATALPGADAAPELGRSQPSIPSALRAVLDREYKEWSVSEAAAATRRRLRAAGIRSSNVMAADFNGDGIGDVALLIRPPESRGEIALIGLGSPRGFSLVELERFPYVDRTRYLRLHRKGTEGINFDDNESSFRYRLDTVGVHLHGKGGSAYLYRGGKFVPVVTSD